MNNIYIIDKSKEYPNQLKLNFNKFSKYNGVVYFSSLENKGVYYLVYILDNSRKFLEDLEINSIDAIRTVSYHISGDVEEVTKLEVPVTDTEMISVFSKKYELTSYGFCVGGELDDSIIKKLKNTINNYSNVDYPRDFKLVKIEKIKIKK